MSAGHRWAERAVQRLDDGAYAEAGELLFSSYVGARCTEENRTDELEVVLDHRLGVEAVLSARLTGGGFCGAVMAYGRGKTLPKRTLQREARLVEDGLERSFVGSAASRLREREWRGQWNPEHSPVLPCVFIVPPCVERMFGLHLRVTHGSAG